MGLGPNEKEPGPVGGRLWEFVGAWEDITSDKWVLQTVLSGYRIEYRELSVNQSTSVDKNPVKAQALCRCGSQGQEVPTVRLRQRNFRVSGLAVWTVNLSQDVYSSSEGGGSVPKDAQNKCITIFRRLARRRRDLSAGPQLPGHRPLGNTTGPGTEKSKKNKVLVPVYASLSLYAPLSLYKKNQVS